jgi:hypothetical protein
VRERERTIVECCANPKDRLRVETDPENGGALFSLSDVSGLGGSVILDEGAVARVTAHLFGWLAERAGLRAPRKRAPKGSSVEELRASVSRLVTAVEDNPEGGVQVHLDDGSVLVCSGEVLRIPARVSPPLAPSKATRRGS